MNASDDGPIKCRTCGETDPKFLYEDWGDGIRCIECERLEVIALGFEEGGES